LSVFRHKSIIAYLAANNLQASAEALRQQLGLGDTFDDATRKQYEGLLEKKWTSVLRQQKKVGISAHLKLLSDSVRYWILKLETQAFKQN
jgi:hypothetical protein